MILTNEHNISLSLAVWLAHDEYMHSKDPNLLSVTTLLKPMRELVLLQQNKGMQTKEDIYSKLASKLGTAMHNSVEGAWLSPKLPDILQSLGYGKKVIENIVVNPEEPPTDPNILPVYLEKRSEKACSGYKISGQFDFVAAGDIEDFKNTTAYGFMKGDKEQDYQLQGSIYKWLNPEIITGDFIKIRINITDWSKVSAMSNKNYPQLKLQTMTIPLLSYEQTDRFVLNKISKLIEMLPKGQEDLPLCTKKELWQSDDTWKYYKKPGAKRATKNYTVEHEAVAHHTKDGGTGFIKHFPGEVKKCKYCPVREICIQAQMFISQGLLTL